MTDIKATEQEFQAGQGYEALFVPSIMRPWTSHVLRIAGVGPGDRVLDIACGTGVLARAARARIGPGGHVIGVDPAAGMLAVARELDPAIDWYQAPAEAVPLEPSQFDAVVSQFGMMFFQDPSKAASEMYRVLKPQGRVAIAVWNSIDHNPVYRTVGALLDELVGSAAGDALRLPFSMGNADPIAAILSQAGFQDVTADTVTEEARFPSTRTLVEAELRGWLPMFDIHLDEVTIASVLDRAEGQLADYTQLSGEAVFPTSAHILSGRS